MKKSDVLRSYLPETKRLNEQSLMELLNKYQKVMLKPCRGRLGYGIIKISLLQNGHFKLHHEHDTFVIKKKQQLVDYITKTISTRKYIIQQYIPLATIDTHPFDIRVMAQRNNHSSWKITGKAAKVASPGMVVTNDVMKILKVKEAIQLSTIKNKSSKKLLSKMNRVALQTVKHLSHYSSKEYSGIGLDIGLDDEGNIWIIEANLKPLIYLFRLLEDHTMYFRIKAYKNKWENM
jgi:hypothetical protein